MGMYTTNVLIHCYRLAVIEGPDQVHHRMHLAQMF
ncbi:hypothetical protein BVRB_017200 [Beta vulgaris subsp. vulgaris]|uniref:Uncharacterized protein n=1 Tax=Beta vulgaris subsp. vulgaris TaxID=3555 RepID=A0A0J7YM85_BETVV|nr:hypothetical protein BVRB_017200 [Beta vulgaris subsp. vulgaris]